MRSPNFLILDEPTNDLDILTLNVLEDYLASFNGCVVVVTHDRYFLDKIVDHLFVFDGDGVIKDFPGNYTQYKLWSDERKRSAQLQKRLAVPKPMPLKQSVTASNKLSFKEKREIGNLEKEITDLEKEKRFIEERLQSGTLTSDELRQQSERWAALIPEIEIKTERWMELSERESQ